MSEVVQAHEESVPVDVLRAFDVLPGNIHGLDCVLIIEEVDNGAEVLRRVVALDSQDAKRLRDALNSVASTVKSVLKQVNQKGESH